MIKLNEAFTIKEEQELHLMDPVQRDRIIFAVGKKSSLTAEEIAQNIYDRAVTRNIQLSKKMRPKMEKAVGLMTQAIKSAGAIDSNQKLNKVKTDIATVLSTALAIPGERGHEIDVSAQGTAFELLQKLNQ